MVISVMVFFMGCLAALNRLEVHSATEQERLYGRAAAELLAAAKQRAGGDVMQALAALGQRAGEEPDNLTLKAAVKKAEAEVSRTESRCRFPKRFFLPRLSHDCAEQVQAKTAQPADAFFAAASQPELEPLSALVVTGACGCCRCFKACACCACCALT